MLDFEFNNYGQEYLTLEIPNPVEEGQLIPIKLYKPTERTRMLITQASIKQLAIQKKIEEKKTIGKNESLAFLDMLEDVVYVILNGNREGIEFDRTYIRTYFGDIRNISVLLVKVTNYMNEIAARKN